MLFGWECVRAVGPPGRTARGSLMPMRCFIERSFRGGSASSLTETLRRSEKFLSPENDCLGIWIGSDRRTALGSAYELESCGARAPARDRPERDRPEVGGARG